MDRGASLLADRGIIKISGAEALGFLHRLVTNSLLDLEPGTARYAALLSGQGKLLFDFFVVPLAEGPDAGCLLDCLRSQIPDLAKKLNLHKLRVPITIEDVSASLAVAAVWGESPPDGFSGLAFADPRAEDLGLRLIAPPQSLAFATTPQDDYEAHRTALGVPKGGVDFPYGDAFVHDADLDWLNGVDFQKGCYPGQEVVARVHFRKSARKRILKVRFDGPPPAPGSEVKMGDINIGHIGSVAGARGLAMLRLDRVEDARAAGTPLMAGAAALDVAPVPPQ
ncbi:MAG: folate-binding protein [Pseudomonadota bacterium]